MLRTVLSKCKNYSKFFPNVSPEDWNDWKWQVRNRITTLEEIEELAGIKIDPEVQKVTEKFSMAISPYYFELIDFENFENDPVRLQSIPNSFELVVAPEEKKDNLDEDNESPCKAIIHKYPDRCVFLVSDKCAMYCRHCLRKRFTGSCDAAFSKKSIDEGIEYIKNTPEIRDVLISGGDPFLLETEDLDYLLTKLDEIDHVEVKRIGSRTPVVLPQRITDDLVDMLETHHPLWINTHFNNPQEITEDAKAACNKLSKAGIPLGNQSVLLHNVNDSVEIFRELVHKLVQMRIRPYYILQCDLAEGTSGFRTPVSKGIEIIEGLRGHTSGFCVPTYIVYTQGGKIPVQPQYMISQGTDKVVLRNFEGVITTYYEPTRFEEAPKTKEDLEFIEEHVEGVAQILLNEEGQSLEPSTGSSRLDRKKETEQTDRTRE